MMFVVVSVLCNCVVRFMGGADDGTIMLVSVYVCMQAFGLVLLKLGKKNNSLTIMSYLYRLHLILIIALT